jgi:hypothetical protein
MRNFILLLINIGFAVVGSNPAIQGFNLFVAGMCFMSFIDDISRGCK